MSSTNSTNLRKFQDHGTDNRNQSETGILNEFRGWKLESGETKATTVPRKR